MDWMMGIGGLVVFASAFVAAGAVRKSMKMKQEVDLFADQVSGGADRETGIPFAEYDKNVKAGNWNYSDTERARKSLSDIDGGGQSDCSRSGTKRN